MVACSIAAVPEAATTAVSLRSQKPKLLLICRPNPVVFPTSGRTLPTSYTIDTKNQLVTSRLWGAVTEDEVHEHNRRLRTDPDFVPSYRQLVDLTGITEIKVGTNLINETSLDQFFASGTRRAFVASDDAAFGMARMFALRAEGLGQVIEVFRDPGKARDWLGI